MPTTTTNFHVSATQIVLVLTTVARTFSRVAVVMTHVLKSVVVPTTARTFHVSATTIVKTMATAARTTKQGVVEATKQHSNPFQVQLKAQVQHHVTHVRKSVVVSTATQ